MSKIGDHYEDHVSQLGIDYEETRGKNGSIKVRLLFGISNDDNVEVYSDSPAIAS
jgi:hypothetical protein